jgi:hypothetical protein
MLIEVKAGFRLGLECEAICRQFAQYRDHPPR